jgi:glutamate-1-semialdehyde aminotransferase
MGKAIANGFPLAVVGGRRKVMAGVSRTWISSTLATEFVSLAAAKATLDAMVARKVPQHLRQIGGVLLNGLDALRTEHPDLIMGVAGVPEMCFLQYTDDVVSQAVTAECARAQVLFKRSAYNFVSLAHDTAVIEGTLQVLGAALSAVAKPA